MAPADSPRVARNVQLLRAQRRDQDEFIYEPVVVGSFQDAFSAIASNSNINAVVIFEGIGFKSHYPVPQLDRMMRELGVVEQIDDEHLSLQLAAAINEHRPELDIYLMSDRQPQDIASDPRSTHVRRVLYAVEEPIELHLSILEGIRQRYETPFLTICSVMRSGPSVPSMRCLLREANRSSSLTGSRIWPSFMAVICFWQSRLPPRGLDSLLEPKGNIKHAQDKAARAFGADHCFL